MSEIDIARNLLDGNLADSVRPTRAVRSCPYDAVCRVGRWLSSSRSSDALPRARAGTRAGLLGHQFVRDARGVGDRPAEIGKSPLSVLRSHWSSVPYSEKNPGSDKPAWN